MFVAGTTPGRGPTIFDPLPTKKVTPEQVAHYIDRFRRESGQGVGDPKLRAEAMRVPGFDLLPALAERRGAFIEIAGPTEGGYDLLEGKSPGRRVYVCNLTPGVLNFETDGSVSLKGNVDFVADGRNLPFARASLGAAFVSCLNFGVRAETLKEIHRVLEPGGLVVWQGSFIDDFPTARKLGFELMLSEPDRYKSAVWRKPLNAAATRR